MVLFLMLLMISHLVVYQNALFFAFLFYVNLCGREDVLFLVTQTSFMVFYHVKDSRSWLRLNLHGNCCGDTREIGYVFTFTSG